MLPAFKDNGNSPRSCGLAHVTARWCMSSCSEGPVFSDVRQGRRWGDSRYVQTDRRRTMQPETGYKQPASPVRLKNANVCKLHKSYTMPTSDESTAPAFDCWCVVRIGTCTGHCLARGVMEYEMQ